MGPTKVAISTDSSFSIEKCHKNPRKLYVFGEHQGQKGDKFAGGGQAVIRGQANAFGFCTLKEIGDYWKDDYTMLNNYVSIDNDVKELLDLAVNYDEIVFPKYGLGTGRANMIKSCPLTFLYMCIKLIQAFGYNNIEHLKVPQY